MSTTRRENGPAGRIAIRVRALLVSAIGALVFTHVVLSLLLDEFDFTAGGQLMLFNLAQERSLGTWVSSALLALAALGTAALASTYARSTRSRRGWLALAGLLAVLSLDEVAMLHEGTIDLVRSALALPAFLQAAWVLPALAIVLAFVAWQWRFFASLPAWVRLRLAAAGALLLIGAIGLEIAESQILGGGQEPGTRVALQLLVGVEEGLEMVATTLVLLTVLRLLAQRSPMWSCSLIARPGTPGQLEHVVIGPVTQSDAILDTLARDHADRGAPVRSPATSA
jgi:hypothetical protein